MYLAFIGYLMVAALIFLIMKGKSTPMVLFVILPIVAGALAGYNVKELDGFIKTGVGQTTANAVLFCFSILYFNMMNDLGIFDPIVNFLIKKAGRNVVAITLVTGLIGVIAHLDGSSSTTLLITIPAMLPIYKKLNMRPVVLLAIMGAALGVMNLTPWAGPINRISVVTKLDPNYLWHRLIPMQAVGLIVVVVLAIYLGIQERKREAVASALEGMLPVDHGGLDSNGEAAVKTRSKLLYFNLALTISLIGILSWGKVQAYTAFMVAFAVAAIVNYPNIKIQDDIIKKYAPAAFFITATMLASGVFVGVLSGGKTPILTEMSNLLLQIIPPAIARYLHIIMGLLAVPIGLVLGGDAYLYGLLPLCIEVGRKYGITPEAMSLSMVIGKNVGMIISPVFASTFLAIGLANVELKDHMKFSFKYLWITSAVMVVSGVVLGIIPL